MVKDIKDDMHIAVWGMKVVKVYYAVWLVKYTT